MKVGLIGRAGSGRSTLFDAVTGMTGAGRQPGRMRLGLARVGDPRLDLLSEICAPRRAVHAEFTLAVPPGSLDVAALREMRDLRALAHVVDAFSGASPEQAVAEQLAELQTEMLLADMERVENRLVRIHKGGQARPGEREAVEAAARVLEGEQPLRLHRWDERAAGLLAELGLVSQRPLLTLVNLAEQRLGRPLDAGVTQRAAAVCSEVLALSAELEREIVQLDSGAQRDFLAAYGLAEPLSQRFARACLALLDQICFFTIGPDEVRAWPVERDSRAQRAARAIHTDLEKGFIRAEVITFDDFVAYRSEAACRAAGRQRIEGKDYPVQDGDIITVRFNV
jgi:ribosome-binding ATPase YchF (GTP1/OBG family)